MYANMEHITDLDFENLWGHSIQHMSKTNFEPHKVSKDAEGNWVVDGQSPFKKLLRNAFLNNTVLCMRDTPDSIVQGAVTGKVIDNVWHIEYFMCGPREGSKSMAWMYKEVAFATKNRHREVLGHTGLVALQFTVPSSKSLIHLYAKAYGAENLGKNEKGFTKYKISW